MQIPAAQKVEVATKPAGDEVESRAVLTTITCRCGRPVAEVAAGDLNLADSAVVLAVSDDTITVACGACGARVTCRRAAARVVATYQEELHDRDE